MCHDEGRPARIEDVHELALDMPHVTVEYGTGDNPVYQVGRKSFVFFRNPRPDAVDPDTGERYPDVIVFWVESEVDKEALIQGARLVHVSSDAVFSGTETRYDESHVPDPTTPYGAAKAAAETAVKGITPTAVIARTSLIIGDGDSQHERHVHALAAGAVTDALFTDDVRCPVHVSDLASALLELAASRFAGIHHVAGRDAISRYELGVLIARRDGLDQASLPSRLRASSGLPGPIDVRMDSTNTQARLNTRLRGAREFLLERRLGG